MVAIPLSSWGSGWLCSCPLRINGLLLSLMGKCGGRKVTSVPLVPGLGVPPASPCAHCNMCSGWTLDTMWDVKLLSLSSCMMLKYGTLKDHLEKKRPPTGYSSHYTMSSRIKHRHAENTDFQKHRQEPSPTHRASQQRHSYLDRVRCLCGGKLCLLELEIMYIIQRVLLHITKFGGDL